MIVRGRRLLAIDQETCKGRLGRRRHHRPWRIGGGYCVRDLGV